MTMEELSSANARRNTARMSCDVQHSGNTPRPPRMSPPLSSRHAGRHEMDGADATDVYDAQAPAPVAAHAAEVTASGEDPVGDAVNTLLSNGDAFFVRTTKEQRARMRWLMVPPDTQARLLYTNPVHAAVVIGVVSAAIGYVIAHQQKMPRLSRTSAACRRVCERTLRFV